MTRSPALLALVLLGATACTSLAPDLELPPPPIPAQWPLVETTGDSGNIGGIPVADIGWRDFLVDERLETLVAQALDNNRDLRVAVLSVARSRELYRIRRADRLPSVDAEASALVTRTSGQRFEDLTLDVGVTAYELDLFGRIRNLSESALEEFFATEEVRRSVQLSLIAEVARTYLLLAADEQLRDLAEETLRSQEESYRLTEQRHDLGAVSGLDLAQARTTVERSRVDAARFAGEVAQDVNALRLLVGGPLDPALLPETLDDAPTGLQPVPPGLPSEVLLRRPDVRAAEHRLRASNADVGAARAAYFPRVSLTGRAGIASDDLGDLLGATTGAWTFLPRVTVPIFQAGRLRAAARAAEVDRDIAVARYEQAIQIGFREAADALALTATLALQREAQDALTEAAGRAYELSRARYRQGRDSYLSVLDSQRTFYAAQQAAIDTRLAEQLNRVTLYRVLGGGWLEEVP